MRKIAVGIISAMVGGAMLVTGAGAASASTSSSAELRIRDISPNPVVVKAGGETKAYFDIGASRDVRRVELSVAPVEGVHTMSAKSIRDLHNWRYSVAFNDSDPAGKWKATAVAFDRAGKEIAKDDSFFTLVVRKQADTRVSLDADPSKIRKGRHIHFEGALQVKDRRWEGVRGQKVNIYYRQSGSSVWKWVASDYTSWGGKYSAETRAYKSGTFKAVYGGNSKLQDSTSRYDYVRVYR
ncbi:hypothetical protein [Nonomuraea jiangxiensis]|uniref:Polysaccharide lyase n=1 Tax=Nonomuraea jiangxiensis TaxID=633440 RepID=A0A1G8UX80_9ACTN|nr:hypothetical protein [Nonomuraea jiangxiensis]SDJ57530.1 hypothetical protein SAMN05421869_111104 [Nonomuraea jiangxiensis]